MIARGTGSAPPVSAEVLGSFPMSGSPRVAVVEATIADVVVVTFLVGAGRIAPPMVRGEKAVRLIDRGLAVATTDAVLSTYAAWEASR